MPTASIANNVCVWPQSWRVPKAPEKNQRRKVLKTWTPTEIGLRRPTVQKARNPNSIEVANCLGECILKQDNAKAQGGPRNLRWDRKCRSLLVGHSGLTKSGLVKELANRWSGFRILGLCGAHISTFELKSQAAGMKPYLVVAVPKDGLFWPSWARVAMIACPYTAPVNQDPLDVTSKRYRCKAPGPGTQNNNNGVMHAGHPS